MLVLGLDTSESPGSVALLEGTSLAVERALPEPLRHAECLLPTIEALLESSGRTREELRRICVNLGPGSFTGLRIGLATAKGMGQARRIELVGVDGTIAYRERADAGRRVCVAIASRRDLVYARWFSEARPRTETVMLREADLVERLRAEQRPMCVVGSAARRVAEQLGESAHVVLGPEKALEPSALAVARIGALLREARLQELEPMYVEPILA
ncbi:MAG: tRNA (adenosine(37)-N6)-threonylcarbamoyltransferase complex dimerization subunit type 1 TsaB [Candidatus Bipolaricaulota bacterium]|nr:tRNA (adenosine(37)-N6)-threonylcarbamoyltransferase complex dimerization subunit type 1 TsaB [Candidatus Bipolaricaulota bacterium]